MTLEGQEVWTTSPSRRPKREYHGIPSWVSTGYEVLGSYLKLFYPEANAGTGAKEVPLTPPQAQFYYIPKLRMPSAQEMDEVIAFFDRALDGNDEDVWPDA